MWNELGISGGTAIVILIALYFVIKWAVKNGIKEAYSAITGKKTDEDIQNEKELKELGLDSEDQSGGELCPDFYGFRGVYKYRGIFKWGKIGYVSYSGLEYESNHLYLYRYGL